MYTHKNTNAKSVRNIFIWQPYLFFHIYDQLCIPCLKAILPGTTVCMYVCMYVCICRHLFIYVCKGTCMPVYMYVSLYVWACQEI